MPRDPSLQKHTLNLRAGDVDYIESLLHGTGIPVSQVIRQLVSKFVDEKRREEAQPNFDLGITFDD